MIDMDFLSSRLDDEFPNPVIELEYENDIELLVAVILSAQCTDKRVNKTTELLFKKYGSMEEYLGVAEEEFAEDIRSCGFFRTKAKNILAALRMIHDRFDDKVPAEMELLLLLPGVGRKTANLMLGAVHDDETIVVDTHVRRVSNRLGLTVSKNPDIIERDLQKLLPKDRWSRMGHQILLHGRYICKSRKPECGCCLIYDQCEWENRMSL